MSRVTVVERFVVILGVVCIVIAGAAVDLRLGLFLAGLMLLIIGLDIDIVRRRP